MKSGRMLPKVLKYVAVLSRDFRIIIESCELSNTRHEPYDTGQDGGVAGAPLIEMAV